MVVAFEQGEIRIAPAYPDKTTIENQALRYLLTHLGDSATVEVQILSGDQGWQANVYGAGVEEPVGKLIYDPFGNLLTARSTSLAEMRRAAV